MGERKRRTKIVATLGPASESAETIAELIAAGVDVFRLNFSHGTQTEHGERIRRIRAAADTAGRPVAVLQDLQGPKIRIGRLAGGGPVELRPGARLVITTEDVAGTAERVSASYEPLPDDVRPGDDILLDDGHLELKVVSTRPGEVTTEVMVGGLLYPNKGMNLPHTPLSAPCLTPKDCEDLRFGLAQGVDYVALSFVRHASDLDAVRAEMRGAGRPAPIIAKIERVEAVANLEEIVAAADGVMVARGDLGVETSSAEVPALQKRILSVAGRAAKPDITATQMLESMIANPRPTRAEASDVANAVFDGTDALMLSAETAVGKYPAEAVRTMARIAETAEGHLAEYGRRHPDRPPAPGSVDEATAGAACLAAREIGARGIAVFTRSGRTALLVSARRPERPIVAFTPHAETYRRLALAWGVEPRRTEYVETPEEFQRTAERCVRASGMAGAGEFVVTLTGTTDVAGATNTMRIVKV